MRRSLRIGLATTGAILALLVAGNIWFRVVDDRRAAGLRFVLIEPEKALEQITQRAETSKTLSASGMGIVIPAKVAGPLGPTQWTISADGRVEGRAPEFAMVVVWTPEVRDGRVEWRCTAEPKSYFRPSVCGDIRRFER